MLVGGNPFVLDRVGTTPERFPYSLFFHIVKDVRVVVAVAHTSRRPGYWLLRTPENEEGR